MALFASSVMKRPRLIFSWLIAATLLVGSLPFQSEAKSYSSGGGRSYSSHSSGGGSSHSFSSSTHSSSTHSSGGGGSSGGSHSSSPSSSKNFSSGSGKSYSSHSSASDSDRRGYSSGKSYSAGGGGTSSSRTSSNPSPSRTETRPRSEPSSSPSSFTFDTAAARARKEETSKQQFTKYKESQSPRPATPGTDSRSAPNNPSYAAQPPPIPVSSGGYRRTVYVPDSYTLSSRPMRFRTFYEPYYYRPVVVYHDPYNSFFWWWLLDRSLDDRAYWAYHHRYDMDPARYQALVATDQQLQARVAELEAQQQVQRDPSYVPAGGGRELIYFL